jgi:flavodoxin
MKAVVVFDSKYGTTEGLAREIAAALGAGEPVPVVAASAASARDLQDVDLLAVGGPTQGHGLSPALRAFLDGLPSEAVRDVPTVTFDTRLSWPRFLAGSAAAASARRLEKKGARLVAPPESFLVAGSEGPLAHGEMERARTWAGTVRAMIDPHARVPAGAATTGGHNAR